MLYSHADIIDHSVDIAISEEIASPNSVVAVIQFYIAGTVNKKYILEYLLDY